MILGEAAIDVEYSGGPAKLVEDTIVSLHKYSPMMNFILVTIKNKNG